MNDVSPVLEETRGAVRLLTLNRRASLNSLTPELLVVLRQALEGARDDAGIRAVVLTGAGRAFSAGADLATASPDRDVRALLATRYAPVIGVLTQMETPVVAAINGVAAGAGLSIALACDLRVAARSARLIQAFVRIGLVPDAGATWLLPRLVGLGRAMEIAMLGDDVDAERAERWGMVNRVVDDGACLDEAMALAERLAAGPRSVGLIKRALRQGLSGDLAGQLQVEEDLQGLAIRTADFTEGVSAFLEKRPAVFQGR